MGHRSKFILGGILAAILWSTCTTTRISQQNLISIYPDEYDQGKHLEYAIFHFHKDSSRIYLLIPHDLISLEDDSFGQAVARFQIQYTIYDSYESAKIIHADTINIEKIEPLSRGGSIDLPVNIATTFKEDHVLYLEVRNSLGNEIGTIYANIYRKETLNVQHVNVIDVETGRPITKRYVARGQLIKIQLANKIKDSLLLYYEDPAMKSKESFQDIALPPYIVIPKAPVTEKDMLHKKIAYGAAFQIEQDAKYLLSVRGDIIKGLPLQSFHRGFPYLHEQIYLATSLRYITEDSEYRTLIKSTNLKNKVDSFWTARAGSYERARTLIAAYYGRVELSNAYFTMDKEGWKTDRGMIYIVFGKPVAIYRDSEKETWIYELATHKAPLTFIFKGPQWSLVHGHGYANAWYNAVNAWRVGRIINMN